MRCKSYFGDYKCHVATNLKDSKGRTIYVDKCLKEAIENLNKHGIKTVASCCGHGIIQPNITVKLTKQNKTKIKPDKTGYEIKDHKVKGYEIPNYEKKNKK